MPPKATKRSSANKQARSAVWPYPAAGDKAPHVAEPHEYDMEGSIRRHSANNFKDVPLVDESEEGTFWSAGSPRDKVTDATSSFKHTVTRHVQQMDALTLDLLSSLQDATNSSPKGRPAVYKEGMMYMEQCRRLFRLYDEHNADVMGPKVDKAPQQWAKEVEVVSKTLDNGASYGAELMDAMLQPSLEPKLPMLDESRATDTEKAAVDMYEGQGLATDTWGRTARVFVDAWSDLLQVPSRS